MPNIDFTWLLPALVGIYLFHILQFYSGLFRLTAIPANTPPLPVTIIVPARNEAFNISRCLNSLLSQNYPRQLIEIIVVDDNSTDETVTIVTTLAQQHPQIALISLKSGKHPRASKKKAIETAIAKSRHEIMVTIDADCEAPPDWLATLISYFHSNVGLVAGPVLYRYENNLFQKLQALEFLALVAAGAGSIGRGKPMIANGANLAYRKKVFNAVQGFQGIDHVASGDDDLLIQKITRQTSWKIRIAATLKATVTTPPSTNLRQFLEQRTRWASKATIYHSLSIKAFLIATYLLYAILLFSLPLILARLIDPFWLGLSFMIKLAGDFLLVSKACARFNQRDLLKLFPLAEILQIPYILLVGWQGFRGKYQWKGRKIKRSI